MVRRCKEVGILKTSWKHLALCRLRADVYGGDRAAQTEMRPWVTVNGVWFQGHEVIGHLPRRVGC